MFPVYNKFGNELIVNDYRETGFGRCTGPGLTLTLRDPSGKSIVSTRVPFSFLPVPVLDLRDRKISGSSITPNTFKLSIDQFPNSLFLASFLSHLPIHFPLPFSPQSVHGIPPV